MTGIVAQSCIDGHVAQLSVLFIIDVTHSVLAGQTHQFQQHVSCSVCKRYPGVLTKFAGGIRFYNECLAKRLWGMKMCLQAKFS